MQRQIMIANVLALAVLLALIPIRSLGLLTGNTDLIYAGSFFLLSPLPVPFRDLGRFENYTQSRVYELHFFDEAELFLTESRALHRLIGGPHRYKIALASAFDFGVYVSPAYRRPIYQYLFCQHRNSILDVTKVEWLKIHQTDKRTGLVTSEIYHYCHHYER